MANLQRNFIAGRMNKGVDERLVPNGEYIDAMNVRLGSTETTEIGSVENSKGNLLLATPQYTQGTNTYDLSSDARCIGAFEDGSNETIYWFIHDPNFTSAGATGKLDLVVSYNTITEIITNHLVSIDDGNGVNTTLNFNPTYIITGVNKVEDLLFWTDNYNEPRFINVTRNYAIPITNIDQFTNEAILVIKKPPRDAPLIAPYNIADEENFLEERFICFAYRYKYADGEFSATSQWSDAAFAPKSYDFDSSSFLNEGMVNVYNAVNVTINTGSKLVVGFEILFKESASNIIKVIDKYDKEELALIDDTNFTITFDNSKIFTILSEGELLRLYDNVPRFAKAQTLMGNRLMYGNYKEGYDLVDSTGADIQLDYFVEGKSDLIGLTTLDTTLSDGTYGFGSVGTVSDSIFEIDFGTNELKAGSAITIVLSFAGSNFSGTAPFPTTQTLVTSVTFSFILSTDYANAFELGTSPEFGEAVGKINNIKPVFDSSGGETSCAGGTWTDIFNCSIASTFPWSSGSLSGDLHKYASGISNAGQPISIGTNSATPNKISFQIPVINLVDTAAVTTPFPAPLQNVYESYSISFVDAEFQEIANPTSLHSNRDYEVGIVYMDEYKRATSTLVSARNGVHFGCSLCDTRNTIQVTIPTTQKPPSWAKTYKFVYKPDADLYETIYTRQYYKDPQGNNTYFLLQGENAQKVEKGDRLIVKRDSIGPALNCSYATVLDKTTESKNFLEIRNPLQSDPTKDDYFINIPAGVYMQIKATDFRAESDIDNQVDYREKTTDENSAGRYPLQLYTVSREVNGVQTDVEIPEGSNILINIKFQRRGPGNGNGSCERRIYTLELDLTSSQTYASFQDWWNGDQIAQYINDGAWEGGDGAPAPQNIYLTSMVSGPNNPSRSDVPEAFSINYYQFGKNTTTGETFLLLSGTKRCGGVLSRAKRRSSIRTHIQIFKSDDDIVFETMPTETNPELFYETETNYDIVNGFHLSGTKDGDQNQTASLPAIINTDISNCWSFGNGVESYKIRDSIKGKNLASGNRVTAVAEQDYKEAHRFADITYSGIYNDESNVNKLNEFNLGLLNFKQLEDSFGVIQKLDGRETDVLVLQEDKISYVLAGKDLLSDAAGSQLLSSVPSVLGTQIARTEDFGISNNPESFAKFGPDKFFTDAKRGAVIRLKGSSAQSEQLTVISETGMRSWFRDLFISDFDTQKLGGFDPYMNEYVLGNNLIKVQGDDRIFPCGQQIIAQDISSGTPQVFTLDLTSGGGTCTVSYNPSTISSGNASIVIDYEGVSYSSGNITAAGSFSFNKNNPESSATMTITMSTGTLDEMIVDVSCPIGAAIGIVEVTLNNAADGGKFIHNQWSYTDSLSVLPTQTKQITMSAVGSAPIVCDYELYTGTQGSGPFPPNGAVVKLISNKFGFDNFVFNSSSNKFRFLRSNTLYQNTQSDILSLLSASTELTTDTSLQPATYSAETAALSGSEAYLYYIWDYRTPVSAALCYSNTSADDACCGC